jgi:histidinol phosphatase-like enzyme
MAHLIPLRALDVKHDNSKAYNIILFNLDNTISIEKSYVHSVIYTQHNPRGIRVMESLDEILELSKK